MTEQNDESIYYETRELTEENIPEIAKRSGKSMAELEMLRGAMDAMGRKPQVRYRVIPEVRGMDRMDEMKDKIDAVFNQTEEDVWNRLIDAVSSDKEASDEDQSSPDEEAQG